MFASAAMLGNVTTSGDLPIAKRVDAHTCFKSTSDEKTNSDFKTCSSDADCKKAIHDMYHVNSREEYPICFARKGGVKTIEGICCNKWAYYENPMNLGLGTKPHKRPILAKKADDLLSEFCSVNNSLYDICSTDKDCQRKESYYP